MDEKTKPIWAIAKIFLFIIFWPITLTWYVWDKTDWQKQNKWIATATIAVVFISAVSSNGNNAAKNETDFSTAKIIELQKQLEVEKQKNATANNAQKTETDLAQTPSPIPDSAPVKAIISTPIPASPPVVTKSIPVPISSGGSFTCNCSKTCQQMSSCAEAQYQLNTCGCTRRDADHDGVACDADCQ